MNDPKPSFQPGTNEWLDSFDPMPKRSILILYAEALQKISRLQNLNSKAMSHNMKLQTENNQLVMYTKSLERTIGRDQEPGLN